MRPTPPPKRVLGALCVGVSVFVLAAGGCRQLVGIEPREQKCGALPFAETTCAECVDASCCSEESACAEDPKCAAAADRLHACGASDAACRTEAEASAPPDNAAFTALAKCRVASCALSCSTCGGLTDPFGAACDDCIRSSCCDVATSCVNDAGCAGTFGCIASCSGPPDCVADCLIGPERTAAVAAFETCITKTCNAECKIGRDWSCVQHYAWKPAASEDKTIRYDLTVKNFLSQVAAPGVSVAVCQSLGDCAAKAVTDASGVASLEIDVAKDTSWTGYLKLSGAGYRTMLVKWSKPLAWDESALTFIVTDSEFALLTTQFKVPVDPTKAMLIATALDCKGINAPDIRFELNPKDPGILTSYFQSAGSDPTKTNRSGTVGFGNVPVSSNVILVSAFLDKQLVGESLAPIESGIITLLGLYPKQ